MILANIIARLWAALRLRSESKRSGPLRKTIIASGSDTSIIQIEPY